MTIEQLLMQSLQLMGIGMGAVFIILCLLIVLISVVSRLIPAETPTPVKPGAPKVGSDHLAAIGAAVHRYRKNRK